MSPRSAAAGRTGSRNRFRINMTPSPSCRMAPTGTLQRGFRRLNMKKKSFGTFHGLKTSVGNNMDNNEDDVWHVKRALNRTGHRAEPADNGIIDRSTDEGIRKFQR